MHATPILLLLLASSVLASDSSEATNFQVAFNKLRAEYYTPPKDACMPAKFTLDFNKLQNLVNGVYFKSGRELETSTAAPKTTPTSNVGLGSLMAVDGKNYFFSKNQKASWFDALQFCRTFGMDLASVETAQENIALQNKLASLGLKDQYVYISGNKIGRGGYIWTNGAAVIDDGWGPNQPSEFATENCMIMWKGAWYDLPCESYTAHFICE